MRFHRRVLKLWAVLSVTWTIYAASYAPFVRFDQGETPWYFYRAPSFYRPVEWLTLQTDGLGSPLIKWARLWGVEDSVSMQAWFYGQRIEWHHIDSGDFYVF